MTPVLDYAGAGAPVAARAKLRQRRRALNFFFLGAPVPEATRAKLRRREHARKLKI